MIYDGIDTVVTALGHKSDTGLTKALESWQGEVHLIGDCLCARTAEEAVLEGLRIAVAI